MKDGKFFNFDGSPKEGIRATRTEVGGDNPLTKQQFLAAKAEYAKFTEMKNLSLAKTFNTWKTLSDGTLVHISSSHGQDRVTITPSGGRPVTYIPRLRGYIISDSHPWGWINEDDPGTNTDPYQHKANRAWTGYPYMDNTPVLMSQGVNQYHALNPGEVTWMSEDIRYLGRPVVVSWKGAQNRQGFFQPKTESSDGYGSVSKENMAYWGPEYWHKVQVRRPNQLLATPTIPGTFDYSYYTVARDWGPDEWGDFVWINGMPIRAVGVVCAAIRKKVDDTYWLRYASITGDRIRVYEAKLPSFASLLRSPIPWPRTIAVLDNEENPEQQEWVQLWQSPTRTASHRHMSLSFNQSATKLGGIYATEVYYQNPLRTPTNSIQSDEIFVTPFVGNYFAIGYWLYYVPAGVRLNVCEFDCETLTLGASVYPAGDWLTTTAGSVTPTRTDQVVAVGYDGDTLVYFYVRTDAVGVPGQVGSTYVVKLYKGVNGVETEVTTMLNAIVTSLNHWDINEGEWESAHVLGEFGRGDYVIVYTSCVRTDNTNDRNCRLRFDCYVDNVMVQTQTINNTDPAHHTAVAPNKHGQQTLNHELYQVLYNEAYRSFNSHPPTSPLAPELVTRYTSPFLPIMLRAHDKSAFAQAYGPAEKPWKYMHIRWPDWEGTLFSFTHLSRDGVSKTWTDYTPGDNEFILSPVFLSSQ